MSEAPLFKSPGDFRGVSGNRISHGCNLADDFLRIKVHFRSEFLPLAQADILQTVFTADGGFAFEEPMRGLQDDEPDS